MSNGWRSKFSGNKKQKENYSLVTAKTVYSDYLGLIFGFGSFRATSSEFSVKSTETELKSF